MKGKNKYVVPLLLAGMTATTGIVTTINQQQQTLVQAETSVTTSIEGAELRMRGGFDDIYEIGKPIEMPDVQVSGLTGEYDLVYTISRGSKTIKTIDKDTVGEERKFTPTYTGSYSVTIEAVKAGVVASKIEGLTIMVEKSDAVITLPTNSEYVIPAKIPAGHENFKIPAPTVEVEDENGESTTATGELKVKLVTPSGEKELTLSTDGTHYAVNSTDLETAGTYQIRYEYWEENALVTKLDSNFQVVKDLDMSDTKLYMKLQGSVPSTGNVKTDITVPKVTVLDSATSTDGINAHLTITYSKINEDGTLSEPKEIDYTNYTFRPEEEGNYILSYKADLQELYGLSTDTYKPSTIIKVTDNKEPSVRPTYEYTPVYDENTDSYSITYVNGNAVGDADVGELLVNRKADVPSIVITGQPFSLPAIYGEDNFSDWEDITFTREIVGNNITRRSYVSTLGDNAEYPASKAITGLTLSQAGNYEIRYKAKDKAGKEIRATYTLVVKDADDVTDAKTEVKLSVGVSSITDKETLTFARPTAKDTYDSEVDVVTKYQLYNGDPENGGTEVGSAVELTKLNESNKYELKIKDVLGSYSATYLRIIATATTDSYHADSEKNVTEVHKDIKLIKVDKTSDNNPVLSIKDATATDAGAWNKALFELNGDNAITMNGEDEIVVTGINTLGYAVGYKKSEESSSPTPSELVTAGGAKLAAFDQGKKILQVPAVSFTDTDENLKLGLTIRDSLGNVVSKYDYETVSKVADGANWVYTISGASFKMSAAGVYTVTFRAEDIAGNVTVKTYGIRVNDKTAPTIVIEDEDNFGGDVEIGEFFEVPVGNLIKNGEVLEGRNVEWQVYGGLYERTSTGFYPLSTGTYYIKYYGSDEMGNMQLLQDDSLYYINAKDTTAPVFNDDSAVSIPLTKAWEPTESNGNKTMKIDIPVLFATDPIRNESVDVVCTVTGPDGSTVKVMNYSDKFDTNYFEATKQGKYTIKYEATDSANNTVSKTEVLALGDCEAPTLEWADEKNNVPSTVKLNGTLELKLSDLTLKDNESNVEYLRKNMTVKLIKPDGTTELKNNGTSGKTYNWTLTETGSYTLSVTLKDEAGMTETYKYTITVPEESPEDKTISPAVGTALVVVSVVILAGVVIYFVVTSRKKATVKTSKTRKKK